jgi:hypothetical protein
MTSLGSTRRSGPCRTPTSLLVRKFPVYRFPFAPAPELNVTAVFEIPERWPLHGSARSGEADVTKRTSLRFHEQSLAVAGLDWMLQNCTTDVLGSKVLTATGFAMRI